MLRHHANERERSRNLEQLRSRLLSAATQMRRPEHARVFLTNANPHWAGRRPIDSCVDERSFEELKRRAAKIASSGRPAVGTAGGKRASHTAEPADQAPRRFDKANGAAHA